MLTNRTTNCWDRRSRPEKCLFVSSLILLLIGRALAIEIIVKSDRDVCMTPGCISIAAEYKRKANLSGDPCNDFYNYACGKYEADTAIPENKTQFGDVKNDMDNRLKDILDNPPAAKENKAFGKVRAYYNACKSLSEIYVYKERPLQTLLKYLRGWPAVEGEKWSSKGGKNFEWTETIYAARKIGAPHRLLVSLSVEVDSKNSSRYVLQVDKATLGMPNASYFLEGSNAISHYLKFMVITALLLGADRDTAEAELKEVVDFEIQLAKLTLIQEDRSGFTTFGDLQRIAPMMNWVEFANQLLMDKVNENEMIIALSPSYLEQLTMLLMKTPKRTVANYLMWRVALSMIDILDDRFRNISLEFNRAIMVRESDEPRWLMCLEKTKAYFTHALSAMYVRRHLEKYARHLTLNLVRDVKEEFLSMLNKEDWMDPITLGRTLNKAKAMEEMAAYPLELLNDTALEIFYMNFSVPENMYIFSVLRMLKTWTDNNYGRLRQIHNRHDWRSKPSVLEVNAFYEHKENTINIPAGILQGIFFASDRPRYINYGAIGSVIGHEITHGFDDQGRKYDEVGNFGAWGQPETDVQFTNKAKCFIDQYSQYKMASVNMTVNGVNTLSENMADNGGVKVAYQAYRKWEFDNYEENTLPGLNFTTRQLFWMSFANVYCMKTTPRNALFTMLRDDHSPNVFRVNGVVSNSPDFSADFKCPIGSPMNPVKKCAIW